MKLKFLGLLISGYLLVGCGGEGSDGSAPAPPTAAPPPTANPPPPPISAPAPSTGELKPPSDAVVSAATMRLTKVGDTATSDRSTEAEIPFELQYNAATRTYTLTDGERTRAFGPSQFLEENSVPNLFPNVLYQIISANEADFLLIAKAPNADPPIKPMHGAYGAWQHNDSLAGATKIRLNYFTYGSPTPLANMPRTGKVKFRVAGTGNFARDDGLFITSSDTTVDVDFAAGTVFAVPAITGNDFFKGGSGGLAGFRVKGSIIGNTVSGDIDSDIAVERGRFKMIFYGPNAEELALVISGGHEQGMYVTAGVGVRYNP